MASRIPVYQPELTGNEKKYVNECLDSTWISSKGEFIGRFEEDFANFCGTKYAVAVSNGTVALHVALLALGIGQGDEVIVPTLTYISSVNAIVYCGAKPVLVESDPITWQMDPKDVEAKITKKTKAIMVVPSYGHPCDMDTIMSIAKKHKLKVVEDCAEAIGTYYKGKHAGNFGDVATYSFFGNKVITTGEGGMVVSDNKELIDEVRHLKGQAWCSDGPHYWWHDEIGYNYRMTNICAAIGVAQMEHIHDLLDKKQQLAKRYEAYLKGVEFHKPVGDVVHSYWMCSILVPDKKQQRPLMAHLAEHGIETRPLFNPAHKMPMYPTDESFPVAEDLSERGINLPSWPGLSEEQVRFIADTINTFLKEATV
jgi:perosamine synthetase